MCIKRRSLGVHSNQIFTNTCVVTMPVKCAIGKATLHKQVETTNIKWIHVLVLSLHIILHNFFSFLNVKSSPKWLSSLYITIYLCCKCSTFLCARTPHNAMKCSIEICLLQAQRKHLWIVFSFKLPYYKQKTYW